MLFSIKWHVLVTQYDGIANSFGRNHDVTKTTDRSDDGTVHSFGRSEGGALGLGHKNDVSIPTPISNLPKINNSEQETQQISMFLKKF